MLLNTHSGGCFASSQEYTRFRTFVNEWQDGDSCCSGGGEAAAAGRQMMTMSLAGHLIMMAVVVDHLHLHIHQLDNGEKEETQVYTVKTINSSRYSSTREMMIMVVVVVLLLQQKHHHKTMRLIKSKENGINSIYLQDLCNMLSADYINGQL